MATNVADSAQRTSHLCVTVLPLLFSASALLRAAVNCEEKKKKKKMRRAAVDMDTNVAHSPLE
jgi:hypothetical protein